MDAQNFEEVLHTLRLDWPIVVLIVAILSGLAILYKKVREFAVMSWGDISRLVTWRRAVSRKARRRGLVAGQLEGSLRRLAVQEEWHEGRFAELEAEVELERESAFGWLRPWRGRSRATRIHRVRSLTIALRKRADQLIVLEGDPGAGKSVALRYLAQRMALRENRRPSERGVLPIYVNLKTFRPPAGRPVSAEDVRAFVLGSLNPAGSRDIDRFLADEFESGRENGLWLFLFDSFDETPAILGAAEAGPIIDRYADAISGFLGTGRSRGIIASREFRGPSRLVWPRFRVMPLSKNRRGELIRRADLEEQAENLLLSELGTLESSVQQLADNPLFLSLVCEYVRDRKAMPESIHAVLESYVMSRLTRDRERIESRFAITVEATRAFAEEMAFQMLSSPELGLSVRRSEIVTRVAQHLGQDLDEAMAAIDALIYSKLAKVSDTETSLSSEELEVAFSHRRLHEYFATCVVIADPSRLPTTELLTNGRWRETAVAVLQTQRPEDTAHLLTEAESLFRQSTEPADRTSRPWRSGFLHILDLLANGLKPERLAGHSIGDAAAEILEHAWDNGDRLDKKWAVELCAAAGTEHAIDYLTRAFDSESLWLRDQAYVQVRRIGSAATRLEPQIRQMLIDMSLGGSLRRERGSVRAQLMRLTNPAPLLRSIQLVRLAPIVAVIAAAALAIIFTMPPMSYGIDPPTQGGVTGAIVLLTVLPVFLRRFSLVSEGRAQRYSRSHLARFGLDSGAQNKVIAAMASSLMLMGLIFIVAIVILFALLDGPVLVVACLSLAGWLACWPHAALFTATSGVWTQHRYWAILPLYSVRSVLLFVRSHVVVALVLVGWTALWALGIIVYVRLSGGSSKIEPWVGAVGFVFMGVMLLNFIVRTLWRAWRRRSDRGAVSELAGLGTEQNSVTDIQRTLQGLRTDQGVQILLHHLRKRELQRVPEIAEFLAFLGQRLERLRDTEGEAADPRSDWVDWWNDYRRDDLNAPLRHPSSETVDELGRILEDAQRTATFGT